MRRSHLAGCVLVLGAGLSTEGWAQTSTSTDTETITVRGKASEEANLRDSAESVDLVDVKDAAPLGDDLGEILTQRTALIFRRSGGLGSPSDASLAGLGREQVTGLVDGIPAELTHLSFGLANISTGLVERAEVYDGIVPIRFGAAALAGAVNVVTDPRRPSTGGHISLEGGSFGTYRAAGKLGWADEDTGFFVRASGFYDRADNDYRMLAAVPDLSTGLESEREVTRGRDGFEGGGAELEAGWRGASWIDRLTLRLFRGDYAKEVPHNTVARSFYGEVTTSREVMGAELRLASQLFDTLELKVRGLLSRRVTTLFDRSPYTYFADGNRSDFTRVPGGEITGVPIDRRMELLGGLARIDALWRLTASQRLELSVNLRYDRREGEDAYLTETGQTDRLRVPADVLLGVAAAAHRIQLFSDVLENELFVKGYFQTASLLGAGAADVAETQSVGLALPGVGNVLRARIAEGWIAKLGYERSARLPGAEEYFGDGSLVAENPDLSPEQSHNLNLSLAVANMETVVGRWSGQLLGFARFVENYIYLYPDDQYFQYRNVNDVRALGAQGSLGWELSERSLFAGLDALFTDTRNTSSDGEFADYTGDRLPNRPYFNGTARIGGRLFDLLADFDVLTFEWTSRMMLGAFRYWESAGDAESKERIPDQLVHGATLSYDFWLNEMNARVALSARNLTDERVYDVIGVQRPGRAFYLSLTAEL